jgi:hypothetical protein
MGRLAATGVDHAPADSKRSSKRLIALTLGVLFLAASVFSAALVFSRLDHAHDHDGPGGCCATCLCLQSAENLCKQLSAVMVPAVAVVGALSGLLRSLKAAAPRFVFQTLVTLKVQLNY